MAGTEGNAREAAEFEPETLVITDQSNPEAVEFGRKAICLPVAIPELYTPIPYIVPAQLFAAHLAEQKA